MGSRPAGIEQRPLVQNHNVLPAQPGEMVHGAATDDAGADDNQARVGLHGGLSGYAGQRNRPRTRATEMRPDSNKSLDIDITVAFFTILSDTWFWYPKTRWKGFGYRKIPAAPEHLNESQE